MLCNRALQPLQGGVCRRTVSICKRLGPSVPVVRLNKGPPAAGAAADDHQHDQTTHSPLSACEGVSQHGSQWWAQAQQLLPKAAALAAVVSLGALLAPHAASAAAAAAAEEGSLLKSKHS